MRKLSILFAVFLLVASFGMAHAELEWEDPVLCVAGQWLVVDAAHPQAVQVTVPQGTAYGDQAAGGCSTPAPLVPLLPNSAVTAKGGGSKMTVMVDGAEASSPVVVSYGDVTQTHQNHGGKMKFKFDLD